MGGTEQKFNLLVHREIQREYGQPAEVVLTMPFSSAPTASAKCQVARQLRRHHRATFGDVR